jgi:hypothetical protein
MVSAFIIGAFCFLPSDFSQLSDFSALTDNNSGFIICVIAAMVNSWYMLIGLKKARLPDYNKQFSVSPRSKST